jgi:phosphoribosylglycinamide formyltransferase-1
MVSGGGSNLQALIDGVENGEIEARICLVIASKPGVYALERARQKGIPAEVISRKDFATKEAFDRANLAALRAYKAEGVVLAGYLSILGESVIEAYRERILNIHPALIPSFCGGGYYGIKVHEAALAYGIKVTGATVHFVDEGTDTGPIVMQEAVPVLEGDTPKALQDRVLLTEHKILKNSVALFAAGKLAVDGRAVKILKD